MRILNHQLIQLREKETKDKKSNSVILNHENRKENIKILYTDCNGLSNKMDELTTRLNYLDADVALICETKFGIEIGNEGLPSNYEIIRKDRGRKRGRSVYHDKKRPTSCRMLKIK